MIAEKMKGMVANSSAIRAMFEEGNRLAEIYGANAMTSSPGFRSVLKITFNPPAAPTVITIFSPVNAVPNRSFTDSATVCLTSAYPLLLFV